ncbi:PREDICTED: neuroligin-1 [Ceratosolen solmsi marchali]|uniref:Neuroligin-1 n=1 Tax=Ceratosolen solmsi marchali TaxID=326594 RepID=A0AAJ6YM45_9HYME|nr:PREDICTED: neuroligin-1 [Ceratosolen solmsi marchali]
MRPTTAEAPRLLEPGARASQRGSAAEYGHRSGKADEARDRSRRRHWALAMVGLLLGLGPAWGLVAGGPNQQKYSTRLVRTRYGSLRGVVARAAGEASVEVYLGVPYATPPLGSLRYMPPITPSPWRGTRLADTMPPVCPQRPPSPDPSMPRGLKAYLGRVGPLLANQSEDCLYLNLYVPRPPGASLPAAAAPPPHPGSSTSDLLPALLLVHGDSYSWGAGNPLDGTALAAHGRLIVVSINFRLGILGFLKTSTKGSAQGNYGLMDLVAGVHWLRENLPAFGGDSNRLTLLGHGTGAALANFLAVSPMAKELVERVVLLGGSSLSPWAIQREPLAVKRRVAEILGCPGDVEVEDVAPCLRQHNVEDLLEVKLDVPRFTSGFAPFVDGAILPEGLVNSQSFQPTVASSGLMPLMPGPGSEFANFGDRDVLMGLTSDEAWLELAEQDLENGLNETRRDRILRTYVRNTYRYHLHEIYSTLRNEYTDWERAESSPLAICEGLLALLGDGQVAAPLLRLALLHSASGGRGYFLHFQPGKRPSQKGDELPYFMGTPLLRAEDNPDNYSAEDESLSRLLVHYLSNFIRRGDPNGAASAINSAAWGSSADVDVSSPPFWDSYDSINQLYLEAGRSTEMHSHYRGHKMSLWLNLLPQLHRPGYEISMRHHHLAESPALYEGPVRPQTMAIPIPAPPLPLPYPTEPSISSSPTLASTLVTSTDCAPNLTNNLLSGPASTFPSNAQHPHLGPGPNNLLRKLATSHYQSYTTALTVTIAVGVFLLLLNILIFAGIYHQRDKTGTIGTEVGQQQSSSSGLTGKKMDDLLEIGCAGGIIRDSSVIGGAHPNKRSLPSFVFAELPASSSPGHKGKFVDELEHMQLQEYEHRGQNAFYCPSPQQQRARTPSPCIDATMAVTMDDLDEEDLPDPPPPPKSPAPSSSMICPGILRQPGTPGCAKKRVQIQEISV